MHSFVLPKRAYKITYFTILPCQKVLNNIVKKKTFVAEILQFNSNNFLATICKSRIFFSFINVNPLGFLRIPVK